MEKIHWERLAAMRFCFAGGAVLLFFALHYLLPLLFPFLIAWLLSLLIRPLAARISDFLHISRGVCSVVLLLVLLGGSIFLIGAALNRLLLELEHLLERLLADGGELSDLMQSSMDYFEALTSRIGFLQRIGAGERFASMRQYFNEMVADMLEGLLAALTAGIPTFLGRVIAALPGALLVSIVTVISGFYFCIDGEAIAGSLASYLPQAVRRRLPELKRRLKRISWRYMRAYLLLLLLTFTELFFGFSILRLDYSFLLALVIAVVDMLPVLGVGTVLVPWAAVLLIQHQFYLGFGLLILYFAVLVLRQILEPRLVGKSLGLHPLLSLFASYVGWQLLGLLGMVLGPLLAMLMKLILSQLDTENTARTA